MSVFSDTFHSILYIRSANYPNTETYEMPVFFTDLNLDQIVSQIISSRKKYNIENFFYAPLTDIEVINYRQEVMREIEDIALFEIIKFFTQKMRNVNSYLSLADRLYNKYNKEGWFLEAVALYCDAVTCLVNELIPLDLKSQGFLAFRNYVANYIESPQFTSLQAETKKLKAGLSDIEYCLSIKDNCIKVRKYESERDYSLEVEKTFEKFKQGAVKDYRVKFSTDAGLNYVEAKILDLVVRLYPEIFSQLDEYCAKNRDFLDRTLVVFEREIQFYLAYVEYMAMFKERGLRFCYPVVSRASKEVYNYEGFDLALAYKCIMEKIPLICNDFYLEGNERIFVVSSPNQGGKTTFARTFGQLHYLASLGCPVPGRDSRLYLFDMIFTHFEKVERIENLRGKLQDDLMRIYSILTQATSHSIIIMNEIFTSTTVEDAVYLSKKVLERVIQLDLLCVYVTFISELASLSEKTVSMVGTVLPDNPAVRTYKIVRRAADGFSYALSIAEKYRLTYDLIKERIK